LAFSVDRPDVARLTEGDANPLPLAYRVAGRAEVLPDQLPVDVKQRTRFGPPAGSLSQDVPVVAARNEADLLAVRACRQ